MRTTLTAGTLLTAICLAVLFLSTAAGAKTVDEYIAEAEALREGGDATAAFDLLEEAGQAFGLPVVTGDTGGQLDLVRDGEGGLLARAVRKHGP